MVLVVVRFPLVQDVLERAAGLRVCVVCAAIEASTVTDGRSAMDAGLAQEIGEV